MESDPIGLWLLLLLALFVLYALLSAVDAAARAVNTNRLRKEMSEEDRDSQRLLRLATGLVESPSTIRVCQVFLGALVAWLAMDLFARPLAALLFTLESVSSATRTQVLLAGLIVFSVYLIVLLVFASALPRRLAALNPLKTARRLYALSAVMSALFHPVGAFIRAFAEALLGLLGVKEREPINEQVTEDEIRLMVDVGEEKGAIEETEREMIENVFEFNNMTAAECMTHRTDIHAIWLSDTVEEVIAMIRDTGLSRFPVYEDDLDHIIGIVTTRDFLLNQQLDSPLPLMDILRKAHYVPDTVPTDVLFRDMQQDKYHMAIVVDEYGGTAGLITMEDLLEEIVGNIYDEYDPQDQQPIVQLSENRWRIAGTTDIETINDETGLDLPIEESYDTVGGLLLKHMDAVPEDGTQPELTEGGLHFRVTSIQDRRIEWVEITRLETEPDD